MSEAPNTSTTVTSTPNILNVITPPLYPAHNNHHHHHHQHIRDYRKGNWTPEETLILITAKKLDDERRVTTTATTSSSRAGGELRWKWVENYCWSAGCLRSQNQCNDKWDNLLRDYKKVRDYQLQAHNQNRPSYWAMDKTQRKQRNLPSNMLPNIYEALNDVVQRKHVPHKQPPLALPPPPPPPPPPPRPLSPPPPPPGINQLDVFVYLAFF
ncbi:hypothetical protein E3N88_29151 [Mikania micrantha]|uniref:Myb-like domain-containing protein n=1 Tax=Mikania micrantha TaxID=192012 RepID=A0A5N6MIM0_9ASTR|nr:hypothetical protein E3N88_29151 [Mikania micrantha]